MFSAADEHVVAITQTVWLWSTAATFALFLVAIFILWGFRERMPASRLVLWIVVIVLVPIAGPILWFVLGRRRYPSPPAATFASAPPIRATRGDRSGG
ncbi:PLDc N-terminal domain-containing protein [Parafrigoribacterium soli]|uniref:PLDc N-terminal domain-containing protein n=1 Tax=Parafrigoribacterium soli TaxID=3144663 RepID=UPI0032EE0DD1